MFGFKRKKPVVRKTVIRTTEPSRSSAVADTDYFNTALLLASQSTDYDYAPKTYDSYSSTSSSDSSCSYDRGSSSYDSGSSSYDSSSSCDSSSSYSGSD